MYNFGNSGMESEVAGIGKRVHPWVGRGECHPGTLIQDTYDLELGSIVKQCKRTKFTSRTTKNTILILPDCISASGAGISTSVGTSMQGRMAKKLDMSDPVKHMVALLPGNQALKTTLPDSLL
jgi:hypothetical protein